MKNLLEKSLEISKAHGKVVKSNPAKKFKAIASTAHTSPIFELFLKEIFLGKSSKSGVGNMVVILQFE